MPKLPPVAIEVNEIARWELEKLVTRYTTPQQIALRARVILLAADGLNNAQIARQLKVHVDLARKWRLRWRGLQNLGLDDLSVEERLEDAPRSGAPARIKAEQVCQIQAVGCEKPQAAAGRPISQWSSREIADEVVRRGIVERISPRHAARLLKIR